MPPARLSYVLAALGFALSSAASFLGAAPRWPNLITWGTVAAAASATLVACAMSRKLRVLDLATSVVVVASVLRVLGWTLSDQLPVRQKLATVGAWLTVCSLMFIVHAKARRIRE